MATTASASAAHGGNGAGGGGSRFLSERNETELFEIKDSIYAHADSIMQRLESQKLFLMNRNNASGEGASGLKSPTNRAQAGGSMSSTAPAYSPLAGLEGLDEQDLSEAELNSLTGLDPALVRAEQAKLNRRRFLEDLKLHRIKLKTFSDEMGHLKGDL